MKKLSSAVQMVCLALERDAKIGRPRPVRSEMAQELKQAHGDTQNYIEALEKQLLEVAACLEDIANGRWDWAWEEIISGARILVETKSNKHLT